MYHFLSGYTAKVAGTERGVDRAAGRPSAPASARRSCRCPPRRYAELLGEKIAQHGAQVWLVNTGWTGGPYGVGERMSIAHTRAMVAAILDGSLRTSSTTPDPVFGVLVPAPARVCPTRCCAAQHLGRPGGLRRQGAELARRFRKLQRFAGSVAPGVAAAGPWG